MKFELVHVRGNGGLSFLGNGRDRMRGSDRLDMMIGCGDSLDRMIWCGY